MCLQSGGVSLKSLWQGLRLFCIFEKSGKNKAIDLAVSQIRGSTSAIISAHVPGQHMWASVGPGPMARAGVQVLTSKQWKSDGRVKIYNSVSTRLPLTKVQRAQQYKKLSCQCTDGLSTAQNGRGAAERFSTPQESNPRCQTHYDSP